MPERKKMYRAFFSFQGLSMWSPDSPAPSFCSSMYLSDCGQYVYVQRRSLDDRRWETIREDLSRFWQPTEAQALAVVAPLLRQIGERLARQADELEKAAEDERHDHLTLADATDE